ncbi:hypothetical protein RQP53_20700 [Paucibacter sp. APW11]|uniref:Transmembrane protein n=1 Tax=Roseateles aquae TaxID=3077235 RepID=A0ABU3PGV5_9BURK|nr:hypothetical protein [Paucibacter sp. APW11]MDT9001709.1 hypothetical protein [Paucibacter sp. APW11]
MLRSLLRLLLQPLRWLARLLLALLLVFEEWGWEPLQRAMAWLGRLPVLRQVEAAIRRLPPYGALALLLLPTLLILPVKIIALWMIGKGRALLGVSVILLAKVAGTALLARLFVLIQPALMQLGWFARLYTRWSAWKLALLAWLHASLLWRQAAALKRLLRCRLKRLKRRFMRMA